ncbi:MAG: hypothetical protein D6705_17885 [Deltaproteobacteria bacterium]|nr:MAG: hypothetical protein D6705_17885 [Deltaproteobacteria bacterium]
MNRIAGWTLPVAALVLVGLGVRNRRPDPDLEAHARETACGPRSGCVVERPTPLRIERGPFRHRYDFRTSLGTAVVECRREHLLVGPWRCGVEREKVGAPAEAPGRYPADIERSVEP